MNGNTQCLNTIAVANLLATVKAAMKHIVPDMEDSEIEKLVVKRLTNRYKGANND